MNLGKVPLRKHLFAESATWLIHSTNCDVRLCFFSPLGEFYIGQGWKLLVESVLSFGLVAGSVKSNLFIYQARESLAWSQQGF